MQTSSNASESDAPTPEVNRNRLLDRFLQYVKIDSSANPDASTYPSSPGQLELGKILLGQLDGLGLDDVEQDENGLVWGTIPATDQGHSATIALFAHLDTSPEASAKNVTPQVIESYRGGDISLPNGQKILAEGTPELNDLIGKTLITTDGNTLLGGDDKAGVAILMELAAYLMEHPYLPHGPIKLLFTCDEEIGHGTDKIDLEKLGATVGYTIDGGGAGQLDVETFSADSAKVIFRGRNIHPAIAKGRMTNAVRAAGHFLTLLPRDHLAPEVTDDREGFLHPYGIEGGVAEASIQVLLRSFETSELAEQAERIRAAATATEQAFPGLIVEVVVTRQYRNMRDGIQQLPESIDLARKAFLALGRECEETIIRGGTDGSRLTELGLPTPNLSSGQHNIHSLHEFACLDEMVESLEHLVLLLRLWSESSRS
jgi:tripeptide aminopeptidase